MQLQFSSFLAKDAQWFTQHSVIYFKSADEQYPLLFFSMLNHRLKKQGLIVESIAMSHGDALIRAKLHTSFLGMTSYYWLHAGDASEKEVAAWLAELNTYAGPNNIGVFVSSAHDVVGGDGQVHVQLPKQIDSATFMALAHYFGKQVHSSIVAKLFAKNTIFSLDQACLLIHYAGLLGTQIDAFIADWMPKIVSNENSLFTLSTYFFAKKAQPFFQLWNEMGREYAQPFWLTYWSEQLWRAYHFVDLTSKKQHGDAKKVSVRLPFSFMQRDWRQTSLDELRNAHACIYALDYNLKNGGSEVGLDLFYSQFFAGDFKK